MAFVPHLLVSFGGALGTTERWSCGLRLTSGGYIGSSPAGRQAHAQAVLTGLVDAIGTALQGQTWWSSASSFSFVKCNPIVETGGKVRYEDPNETNELSIGIPWQTGQGTVAPFQCSHVISLRTAARRGIAHVGRIYVPAAGATVTSSGQIPSALRDGIGGAGARLIRQVNEAAAAADGITTLVSVVSRGVGGGAGNPDPGPYRPVTHVRVGSVIDTQRRRREGIPEAYQDFDMQGVPITPGS